MTERLVLRECAAVVTADLRLRSDVDLVVEDGVITEIGTGLASSEGRRVPGLLAVPCMINCHTHLGDSAFADRGFGMPPGPLLWPPDGSRHRWMAEADRQLLVDAMRTSAQVMLSSGTVAFADFREQGVAGISALQEAVEGLPLEAIVLGRPTSFPLHPEEELTVNHAPLSQATRREAIEILRAGDGFSLVWANDTTDPGLSEIRQLRSEYGGRLAIHAGATGQYRELSVSRTGCSDVARVAELLHPDFVVHMTAGTPEEFALLSAAGIPVVMCARTQAALGQGIPPLLVALDQGVTVALGTDNAMISSPDLLAELNFFARALRGITGDPARPTAAQLLAAVTTEAARTLGLESRLGWIDVGREATFFLLDTTTDNLRYSRDPVTALVTRATAADIRAVFVRGHLVAGALSPSDPIGAGHR